MPITTNDWFTIDDAMLKILAERSARWSLANEIGSGHAASGSRKSFTDAARDALVAVGALIDGRGYMLDKILQEVNVKAPHAYLNHGNFGWGPNERVQFFNGNPCDLYLSIHEYDDGTGAECIVSRLAGADAPPDSQIRIAKIFAKYIDPFNQGLRTGGVTKEEPNNSVGMLHHGNTVRDKYAYFELEFMNAINPNDTDHYRYEEMVTVAFQERVARQIVDGIVEVLLDPQGDFDSVTLNGEFFPPPGTKLW